VTLGKLTGIKKPVFYFAVKIVIYPNISVRVNNLKMGECPEDQEVVFLT
jgi:hypothetical protein